MSLNFFIYFLSTPSLFFRLSNFYSFVSDFANCPPILSILLLISFAKIFILVVLFSSGLSFHYCFFYSFAWANVCAQLLQSCPTLCDPVDCSLPGSSVHGILQARRLEWVAMPSSRGSSPSGYQTHICIACRFLATEPIGRL